MSREFRFAIVCSSGNIASSSSVFVSSRVVLNQFGHGPDPTAETLAATDDQVLLHAGRAVCRPDGTRVGTILVHVVLDYGTLPFVADLDPAGALVRAAGGAERTSGDHAIAFAVYGWGRTPVYPTAGTAWPISASLLQRIYHQEREPFWEELHRGDRR